MAVGRAAPSRSNETNAATADPDARLAQKANGQAMMASLARAGRSTTQGFVPAIRGIGVTPHVAQHRNGRRSAIDGRTTRHAAYAVSQRIRERIEEVFGWGKEVAGLRRMRSPKRLGAAACPRPRWAGWR